jgi:hypothetical protein
MNIKGISYKTAWIEFSEICAESKKISVAPTGEHGGKPLYTIPTLDDPATRTAVSDSQESVAHLKRLYPAALMLLCAAGTSHSSAASRASCRASGSPRSRCSWLLYSILSPRPGRSTRARPLRRTWSTC